MALAPNLDRALRIAVEILRLQQPHERPDLETPTRCNNVRRPNHAKYPVGNASIDSVIAKARAGKLSHGA